jgi:hypothetical protein
VTGIEIRWINVNARPMAIGANPAGTRLGGPQNDEDEESVSTSMTKRRGQRITARRMLAITIGSKAAELEVSLAAGNHIEGAAATMPPVTCAMI